VPYSYVYIYTHIYIYIYVYIYLYAGCNQSWQGDPEEDETQGHRRQAMPESQGHRRQEEVGPESVGVPACCDEATALWVGHHLHISPNKSMEGQASSRQARRDLLQVLSKSKGPLEEIGEASAIFGTGLVYPL